MMLNKYQTALLTDLQRIKASNSFFAIDEFENGSCYFQLTPDVRRMKKEEAILLRSTFEPYLPYYKLWVHYGEGPRSYRMGCTVDDIAFPDDSWWDIQMFYVHPKKAYVDTRSSSFPGDIEHLNIPP